MANTWNLSICICLLVFTLQYTTMQCSRVKRLTGGWDVKSYNAPFIVSLQKRGKHYCSGSILNRHWVLTAAHCLVPKLRIKITTLKAGNIYVSASGRYTQKRKVNYYVRHEQYVGDTRPYDIGLIYTRRPFKWNKAISPISLPSHKAKEPTGAAFFYGWGSISTSDDPEYPSVLQKALVPIIPTNKCKRLLGGKAVDLHPTNICAGFTNGIGSICLSDSGGPLVQIVDNKNVLIGVASWAKVPCGDPDTPSVYGRVASLIKWITKHQFIPK